MAEYNRDKTIVVGHKNPDTDSICSAICYAALKEKITGGVFEPRRAGQVNEETQYVLDYFGVEAPRLIEDVRTEIRDIDLLKQPGVDKNISLRRAWKLMQDAKVNTLAAVNGEGVLEGLITVGDITRANMNVYDSKILSKACTSYANILEVLEADMFVGDEKGYFSQGKVLIAAANPDLMEYYIEKGDLVILGNRYESQLCAIEMEAACIIVCEGAGVSMTIKKLAEEKHCTVIATAYDTYTTARLLNQSMPINYFMKTEDLVTFYEKDAVDEIKDVMTSKRFREFPIVDKENRFLGLLSRRRLLTAQGKKLILVDHNEMGQAVNGAANARIMEIIDHHRLGTVQTMVPVFFRNQPLGCTATIIYQMYQENQVEVDRVTAGLLCSAIISDTLLFRSPTCTPLDKATALKLAEIAQIEIEQYASDMFSAGSNLKSKTDDEIFYQDFKRFTAGKLSYGVGQLSSMNAQDLEQLRIRLKDYLPKARAQHGLDMIFFMLTNILTEDTILMCDGKDAEKTILDAFRMEKKDAADPEDAVTLKGVVSRKKQLIPAISMLLQ